MCLLVVPEISSLKVPTGDPVQSHSISEWSNKGKNNKNKGEVHLPTGLDCCTELFPTQEKIRYELGAGSTN